MIYHDQKHVKKGDEHLKSEEIITRKIAIAFAFVGVFFFFVKILFL